MVAIGTLGSGQRIAYAHGGSLTERGSYFSHAIYVKREGSKSNPIQLPMDGIYSFSEDSYLYLVHFGKVPWMSTAPVYNSEREGDDIEDLSDLEYGQLLDLYQLAFKVRNEAMLTTAVNALLAKYSDEGHPLPSMQMIADTYQKTKPDSPLRRLLVNMHVWSQWSGRSDCLPKCPEEDYNESIYDVTCSLITHRAKAGLVRGAIPEDINIGDYEESNLV